MSTTANIVWWLTLNVVALMVILPTGESRPSGSNHLMVVRSAPVTEKGIQPSVQPPGENGSTDSLDDESDLKALEVFWKALLGDLGQLGTLSTKEEKENGNSRKFRSAPGREARWRESRQDGDANKYPELYDRDLRESLY